MFHINKSIYRIACITGVCFLTLTTPIFATPVSDTATHNILSNIYDRLGTMWTNYMVPIYTVETRFFGTTYTIDSLYNIISAVGSQTSDVSSKLVTTNNYLSNISGYTDGIEGSLSTINSNLVTYTKDIQWYLNEINKNQVNWNSLSYSPSYYDHNMNSVTYSDYASIDTNVYVDVPNASSISNSIIHIRLPLSYSAGNYFMNISFEYERNSLSFDLDYFSIPSFQCVDIYYICPIYASNTYIKLSSNTNIRFTSSSSYPVLAEYITTDNEFYSLYYKLMQDHREYNDIHSLKELYASDDLVAAKQGQQNYEDQVIDNFTGSGSAAASGSDATSLKNISGSLKSGLNSGGSVSGALGVFNNASDLWKWFSQDNYNDINGQNSRSDNGIIDFYHINQNELQELLNDSNR